ncbi:hypothetical protein QAD02_012823 [Eretmocerus hayati]|uniref:Uncharacterized protein n=2 Tax=Eretmocerus hayati TaxID=131215 RepID=A0ACC2P2I5_9HYME|nr:hypothetical protein QAD02_005640 [Eretmocerus hayati]KAJ8677036.1 hypothetical protein QAD02_012823 [Eretmocerus hayati]
MNAGFVKACSENLPNVTLEMLMMYLNNSGYYSDPELQNVKTVRSMRPNYGDFAVGYVQLLREGDYCFMEAKICPEHKVKAPNYPVQAKINEKIGIIVEASCQGCAASKGGCKHTVAFIAWMYRKSQEPSPTSVQCYWKKPLLSTVGGSLKFVTIKDMLSSEVTGLTKPSAKIVCNGKKRDDFLQLVLKDDRAKKSEGHIFKFFNPNRVQLMSLHYLSITYGGDRNNVSEFLEYCSQALTPQNCVYISKVTNDQSKSKSWYELRYARIGASIVWECAHCKTFDGSLVQKIFSQSKIDTSAMKRGRELEPKLLPLIGQELKKRYGESTIRRTGFRMKQEYPFIGASPDGETDNAVIELKCPSNEKTAKNYHEGNVIKDKYRAQLQVQMFFANKSIGYFCVASPNVEKDKKMRVIVEKFDKPFTMALLTRASRFWEQAVFPKLMNQ